MVHLRLAGGLLLEEATCEAICVATRVATRVIVVLSEKTREDGGERI